MSVKSAYRALEILELLAVQSAGLSVTEVANQLGYPSSSTYALLQTLVQREYVCAETDTQRYRLGAKLLEIGSKYLDNLDIVAFAHAPMRAMREECDETISLAVYSDGRIVLVHKEESSKVLRTGNPLGSTLPLHASAMGKAILSSWPESEATAYLNGVKLQRMTRHTKTDPVKLEADLNGARRSGVAYDIEESTDGVCAVATVIDIERPKPTTTLAIVVPKLRAQGDEWERLPQVLESGAKAIRELSGGASFGWQSLSNGSEAKRNTGPR